MAYISTAKQRLWLECCGCVVPKRADNHEVRGLFDGDGEDRFRDPPNERQLRMAHHFGIDIANDAVCIDVAKRLYQILLAKAWVYSVWRVVSGEKGSTHESLSLSDGRALAIALEMDRAGMTAGMDEYTATGGRAGDVFFRMTASLKDLPDYQFVLAKFAHSHTSNPPPRQAGGGKPIWELLPDDMEPRAARQRASITRRGKGCLGVFLMVLFGILAGAFGFAQMW